MGIVFTEESGLEYFRVIKIGERKYRLQKIVISRRLAIIIHVFFRWIGSKLHLCYSIKESNNIIKEEENIAYLNYLCKKTREIDQINEWQDYTHNYPAAKAGRLALSHDKRTF